MKRSERVQAEPVMSTSPGVDAIAAERRRQLVVEGWTVERDVKLYAGGQLARAAQSYAWAAAAVAATGLTPTEPPRWWPWRDHWWKPESQRRCLEKAGALIAAEIDRLDAIEKTQ
jgi:hypothetical protein